MGLQNISCPSSSVFMMGILKIVGYMNKRKQILDNVFFNFFKNTDTKEGWEDIQSIIEPHGITRSIPTGATTSKPNNQGDGSNTQFMVERQHPNLYIMYKKAVEVGNIKYPDGEDPEDSDFLKIWSNPQYFPIQNQESTMRWNAIISAYEIIHEMDYSVDLMLESIKPLYYSLKSWSKSPTELYFYGGDYMNGNLISPDSLQHIPWETIDYNFKSGDLNNPKIIDVIFYLDPLNLWYLPIPTITFESGGESFPNCDPGTTYVYTSDVDDGFKNTGTFSPDPPTPDPPPPAPPYTHVTGTVTADGFDPKLYKVKIIPGTDPVDTGTVSVTYKKLVVIY